MQRPRTHFEQIPVEAVKKIAAEVHDNSTNGNESPATRTPPSKLKPHRLPSLEKSGRRA
jgi:hypothetical protein